VKTTTFMSVLILKLAVLVIGGGCVTKKWLYLMKICQTYTLPRG
jgi:hypothetical protein